MDNKTSLIDFSSDTVQYKSINGSKDYDIIKFDSNKKNKSIDLPKSNINFQIFMDKIIVFKE
ncbi:hypothetical protein [Clostridium arbusti]|nr:hypothetical protein [Clostridium arbusti]